MAKELMRADRALAFDPVVLDAFFAIEERILEIAATFQDEAAPEMDSEFAARPIHPLLPAAISQ
jgi:HD-GYP domain-containing protein (c-di-GMP phosphodiesterase class II)